MSSLEITQTLHYKKYRLFIQKMLLKALQDNNRDNVQRYKAALTQVDVWFQEDTSQFTLPPEQNSWWPKDTGDVTGTESAATTGSATGSGGSSSSTMSSSTNMSDKERLKNADKRYRQLETEKDAEIAALQRLLTTNARTDQIEQQLASMTAERNRLQQEKVYQEGALQQQENDIDELRANNNLHLSTLEKQYETQKDENATLRDQLKKMKQEEAVRKAGRKGARAAAAAAPLLPYSNLTKGLKDANRKLNQLLSGPLETIMKKLDELHVTINDEENKNEEENTEENNNEEENNEEENTEEEQTGETVQNAVPP